MFRKGFTLIELLVVVVIIVVLLAVLVPSLMNATNASVLAKDLSNLRTIAQALNQYASSYDAKYPSFRMDSQEADSYDMRAGIGNMTPVNVGPAVADGLLPTTKLGELMHCPVLDNLQSGIPGHCMDYSDGSGRAGGSAWTDPTWTGRIIVGYQYRSASWAKSGKGSFRTNTLPAGTILIADLIDKRFRGNRGQYTHEGYNRAFNDGSGGLFPDPADKSVIQNIVDFEGETDGRADGRYDAGERKGIRLGPGGHDEKAYETMKHDQ